MRRKTFMLIALYFFITEVAVPQIGAYALALVKPTMIIIITLAGLTLMFSAVGLKISNNVGSTIVGGSFRGIGFLVQTLFQAIGWIVRNIFRMIPRVFNGSRRTFTQMGLNAVVSNILAIFVTVIILAIII